MYTLQASLKVNYLLNGNGICVHHNPSFIVDHMVKYLFYVYTAYDHSYMVNELGSNCFVSLVAVLIEPSRCLLVPN